MLEKEETSMPEFLMLIAGDLARHNAMDQEEVAASTKKVLAWFEEHTRAGRFVAGAGRHLQPPATAMTVTIDAGPAVVTDGPFAETKEQIGGFAVMNARDLTDALEFAKTWPGLPGTKLELRPVY
jgi:hypothetical protein